MKLDEIIPEKSIVLDESVGFTIFPVDNNNLALVLLHLYVKYFIRHTEHTGKFVICNQCLIVSQSLYTYSF
jgi:hypothetical protein